MTAAHLEYVIAYRLEAIDKAMGLLILMAEGSRSRDTSTTRRVRRARVR